MKTTVRTGTEIYIGPNVVFLVGLLFEELSKINSQKVTIEKAQIIIRCVFLGDESNNGLQSLLLALLVDW